MVTYNLLKSACVTYETLCRVIGHQALLTQPYLLPTKKYYLTGFTYVLEAAMESGFELTTLVIPLHFVRRVFIRQAIKPFSNLCFITILI